MYLPENLLYSKAVLKAKSCYAHHLLLILSFLYFVHLFLYYFDDFIVVVVVELLLSGRLKIKVAPFSPL
jgi:hypothetical protein